MEPKNDSKNVPVSDSRSALAILRENSRKRIESESVQAFKELADACALAHTEMKRNPSASQFADSLKNVREAFSTLRAIAQEANAARSLERTQKRAKRFGVDIEFI